MIALLMVAALVGGQESDPVFVTLGTFHGVEYRAADVLPRAGIFWLRHERDRNGETELTYALVQVQCLDRHYRGLHTVRQIGTGSEAIVMESLPADDWAAPRPGSAEEGLVTAFCDQSGGT